MARCPKDKLTIYAPALTKAMVKAQINTVARAAIFLGEIGWESAQLSKWGEDLSVYTADMLIKTWPSRFNTANAAAYEHNAEKIANRAYAGRFGNGDEASGDGWRYRGRGPMGVTFKDNYKACGDAIGIDLVAHPELLEQVEPGMASAVWFWTSRNLNPRADAIDVRGTTLAINGAVTNDHPTFYPLRLEMVCKAFGVLAGSTVFW